MNGRQKPNLRVPRFIHIQCRGSSWPDSDRRSISSRPEIGVDATKSFTAQLCLVLLAYAMDGLLTKEKKLLEISPSSKKALQTNTSEIAAIAENSKIEDFYFLAVAINSLCGRRCLKTEEVCYVHAEGMAAGELETAPWHWLKEGTPCCHLPTDYTYADILQYFPKLKCVAQTVIGISNTNQSVLMIGLKSRGWDGIYPLVTVYLATPAYHSALSDWTRINQETWRNSVTVK